MVPERPNLPTSLVRLGLIDRYPATVTYGYDLAMMKNNLGLTLTYLRPADAEATFQGAIAIWQRYAKELPNDPAEFPKWLAYSTTNLAFHLSNCPDATLRNPQRGVELAKQATQILPDDALTWNNLGTAHYRNNEFAAAATALQKGIKLSKEPVPQAGCFLAMAYRKLDRKEEARQAHAQAVKDAEKEADVLTRNWVRAEEVRRVHAEAMTLLGP